MRIVPQPSIEQFDEAWLKYWNINRDMKPINDIMLENLNYYKVNSYRLLPKNVLYKIYLQLL